MLPLLISLAATDPVPTDDSVKAGWTAFLVFLLLAVAIVVLGWSFSRQLKKVKKADEAGVYGSAETVEAFQSQSQSQSQSQTQSAAADPAEHDNA